MSTVEIETGTYIKRWAFWNPATWSIPKLYWDAWSQEQRLHAICRQLEKVIKYADYLGVNTDDIAARLKAIEEGQLDPIIEAAIEAWFEEHEPEIAEAIEQLELDVSTLKAALPVSEFDSENTVYSNIEHIKSSLLVCVDDYGAVGDGNTDCTAAIQQCIDENPNATIFFKKGVYVVTDQLTAYGRNGAQTIELGGCIIDAQGYFDYVIEIDKDKSADDLFENGTPIVKNGIVNCNNRASGIYLNDINCDCEQITIRNPISHGLKIGNPASPDNSSANCIIENCHIENEPSSIENWYQKTGIVVESIDNKIIETNIFRFGHGIEMQTTGNVVQSCHIYAGIHDGITPSTFKTSAIYTTATANELDPMTLLNNYIDNCFYYIDGVFYEGQFNSTINIDSGSFLWTNSYGVALTESYILNPNLAFMVNTDNLTIQQNTSLSDFIIYDTLFRDYTGGVLNVQSFCVNRVKRSRARDVTLTPYAAQFRANEEGNFLALKTTVSANDYHMVGCIAKPLTENANSVVKLQFSRSSVNGINELTIGSTTNALTLVDSGYVGTKTGIKVAVAKAPAETIAFDNTSIGIFPIYIGGINNSGTVYGYLNAIKRTNTIGVYILPQPQHTRVPMVTITNPDDYIIY